MGAFAQLQLGADALNLAGSRAGGVTVARALLESGFCGRSGPGCNVAKKSQAQLDVVPTSMLVTVGADGDTVEPACDCACDHTR